MEGTDPASALTTTHSLEELADVITAYEEKVNAAAPSGNASEDMEQFMDLKQEEKTIDQDLDLHEDELEYLYRNGSLSREEYKSLERELERLEDRLDAAEDLLEYTFGMDD
jgi:predicted  nucleic acid-binding Zn-ribbon protein